MGKLIGEVETSLQALMQLEPGSELPLTNPKKKNKRKSYRNSGRLVLSSCQVEEVPTFIDYTGRPNQYLTAINSVGEIIQDYDTDKLFPALGFGARLPPFENISHEFFLNLSTSSPYCEGIEGVVAAYHQALNSVQLYGPTNFSPVINHVAKIAAMHKDKPSNYQVLLIITDGIITDMDATKHAIIAASHLPMSIIIVGVGSVDFAPMEELDSDDQLLQLGSSVAKRDIVQFVELNQFLKTGFLGGWDKDLLAREVLAELPGQIVGFMRAGGHKPGRS